MHADFQKLNDEGYAILACNTTQKAILKYQTRLVDNLSVVLYLAPVFPVSVNLKSRKQPIKKQIHLI